MKHAVVICTETRFRRAVVQPSPMYGRSRVPIVVVTLQVYILSRMGNNRAALALIIERLQDIPRAIEFVRAQRDEELVEELIDWALRSADTTGMLSASMSKCAAMFSSLPLPGHHAAAGLPC